MANCYYCERDGVRTVNGMDGVPRWVCAQHVLLAEIDNVDSEEAMAEVDRILKSEKGGES